MLIFNSFDNDSKFIEIQSFGDLEHIESDCYVFIRIVSEKQEYLESCFKLGKKLHKNDIKYAVLLDDSIQINFIKKIDINEIHNETLKDFNYIKDCNNKSSKISEGHPLFPFSTLFFMFSKHGANFFILDKKNYKLFPMLQTIINYYLMDMKLLLLVDSYMDIEDIFSWMPHNSHYKTKKDYHRYIGVDGVIERSLIIKKCSYK